MDKLSALNAMLRARHLRKVASVDSTHPDAIRALDELDDAIRDVQTQRWWFNYDPCRTLAKDTDGKVPVPATAMSVDPVNKHLNYVKRDGFLYDVVNATFVIDQDVLVELHEHLAWDDLPEMAQTYVRDRAVVNFLDTSIVTPDVVRTKKDKASMSYALLRQQQLAHEDVDHTDNPMVKRALAGYQGGHTQAYSEVWQNSGR